MDIYIRNIDPGIKIKLKENAKKKGISLNEYVKNILETAALSIEVTSLDDKYSNLTKELLSIYTGIIISIHALTRSATTRRMRNCNGK